MRRALFFTLPTVLLVVVLTAGAGYPNAALVLQPRVYGMSAKAPTKLTAAAPGEVHVTLSGTGACIRYACGVDGAYLTSSSASPSTATADSNPVYSRTIEKFCLPPSQDYLSLYLSAAGTCYVAELNSP